MLSTEPDRRALLATLAAGLAGCLQSYTDGTGPPNERAGNETRSAPGNGSERDDSDADDGAAGDEDDGRADHDADEEADAVDDPVAAYLPEDGFEAFDCATLSRPAPDVEGGETVEIEDGETVELLGAKPYPEVPEDRSRDGIEQFVTAFDEVYVHNRLLRDYIDYPDFRMYRTGGPAVVHDRHRVDGVSFLLVRKTPGSKWVDSKTGRTTHFDSQRWSLYAVDVEQGRVLRYALAKPAFDVPVTHAGLAERVDPTAWALVACSDGSAAERGDGSAAESED